MRVIDSRRFDALAGYIRAPMIMQLVQEAAWYATDDERLLGIVVWDRTDYDFGWVVLGRDRRQRYRAIAQDASLPTFAAAADAVARAMQSLGERPDEDYHQGDEEGGPVDFFAPLVPERRMHPSFRALAEQPRFSPARELVSAMMRSHEDVDGNFVEQFQTTAFDPRLWELYLYATFVELGYARSPDLRVPDLMLEGPLGRLAIEATTANPPQGAPVPTPRNDEEIRAYLQDYVPIKLARALRRKLYHPQRYWNAEGVADAPFVIALQDFHAPGAMTRIVPIATEYVFGVRHSVVAGRRVIERIGDHAHGGSREPSGFFGLPESENVSAVLLNPLGTLPKFNRLGYLAGFGDCNVRMVRMGLARGEGNPDDQRPWRFEQDVSDPAYAETWVEGMVVLHNPGARVPLDPGAIPGADHEFLRPDGSIVSLLPGFQPYMSSTLITMQGRPGPPGPERPEEG